MGQSLSQKVEEKTELLKVERSMRDKLECTKAKLYIDALNDECVAIVCAVAKFDGMLYIEDAKRTEPKDEIGNIIRRYLHMEPKDAADKKLIDLVTEVVKTLLSSKQAGKYEDHHYHVVYSNKGFIRFDYFICLEILTAGEATGGGVAGVEAPDGVKTNAALSYYGQVGLMNVTNAKPQVLMYELRRATEDKHLEQAGKELMELEPISSVKAVGTFLVNQNGQQPSPEPHNQGDGSG